MFHETAIGAVFQGATFFTVLSGALYFWIKGMPDRGRVKNETTTIQAKIEEDLRGEAAERFREFRVEVNGLRNELMAARDLLQHTVTQSLRRADKLNMVLFILRLVMDELHVKEPTNRVLAQARTLLSRVEDEPHEVGNSTTLNHAVDTVEAAQATVREVMAEEAKK